MLVEIRCNKFRKKIIEFHEGLNVVLGDENATNSIGKSTLLMVIDFVFGGNNLLKHNTDLVEELGHHDYYFAFEFNEEKYKFRRGTFKPDLIFQCDEDYEPQELISLEEFTALLKAFYGIQIRDISFRSLIGLYFRVWGKDNLTVTRPLHIVQTKSMRDCISDLIKTFDRFESIKELTSTLKSLSDKNNALKSAFKNKIIPKINTSQHKENIKKIELLENEIEDIKRNLAQYAVNIAEVANREVMELKLQKDELLALKLKLQSKLARIKKNLSENRHITNRNFSGVIKLFPEIDQQRLANIEEFHNELASLLRAELREAEQDLEDQIARIDGELNVIDAQIAQTLISLDNPTIIVDRVYKLGAQLATTTEENQYFEDAAGLKAEIKNVKNDLSKEKLKVIKFIQDVINDGLRRNVSSVFGPERKSPTIQLEENRYSYQVFEDTGTGTAYYSLIVLDLTIFQATVVPAIAHDSVMFKNIENDSVVNLFKIYNSIKKQSFVAIDEIDKYGLETSKLLRDQSVIQLDDENVLYEKDWRKRNLDS